MVIRNVFKKAKINRLTANMKTNLRRIKQKIEDWNKDKHNEDGPYRITDMIRATIVLMSLDDFEMVFT